MTDVHSHIHNNYVCELCDFETNGEKEIQTHRLATHTEQSRENLKTHLQNTHSKP